ncbi:hypothetical protein F441_16017 [Phytophthora nicotianae CJ01A1]|uniref:RxLR effector protein n=6 Tax=Phytophthora nicotianae TaxID=4792 RepID=W2PU11_PHYN3|nr:hypothetical protein PPTG_15734 [Phytophthora nicotianae INRA-310]ETL31608.1 hypothetical protein L916_15638 [Phytophthora nicotianae]ETO66745.1 hypothetical protein F444_16172 [Phytophthora nicotianae P1976]ETP07857.1 hypothetical protein F441_16017 [Phytophthora nicotianae CJ01A1]ETP35897.1 hypothetical protein F442_16040 [Phytophthora nicotianae P10297]ETN03510.1 hypothetical protein PPTG_15734 [Phytophthora nicotianae INRA-310]
MRLSFLFLVIVAILFVNSEARSLRQGSSKRFASNNDAESEERVIRVRNPLNEAVTTAESVALKASKWDKFRNKLAKFLLPDTSDYKIVYNNGRWRSEKTF